MFGVNELSIEEAEQKISELNAKIKTEGLLSIIEEDIPVFINGKYYYLFN